MCAIVCAGILLGGASSAHAQYTWEQTLIQLTSKDADVRRRAVRAIEASAALEAAVPLAPLVLDPQKDVQLEAIAAELNIFLAERVTPTHRVGFLVEVRGRIAAEPIFSAGPSAVGARRVPAEVARALVSASHDDDHQVALEALYAFGTLAGEVTRAERPAMLAHAAPLVASLIGAPDPAVRQAAVLVAGRVYARRAGDPEVDGTIGDAVVAALNDREDPIRETAMWALGSIRYSRAVRGLTDLFHYYRSGPLATASFDALAHISQPASLQDFDEQLAGRDRTLRLLAIEGLARTGDASRVDQVLSSLGKERDDRLLLAGHFANVMLARGPADALIDALTRSQLREQTRAYIAEAVAGRVDLFARYLQGTGAQVRIDLIDALGLSGDPAAAPALRPLTGDADPLVARSAARALARLGTPAQ